MPESEAQRRATAKWRKANTKQVVTVFYPSDMELYEYLCKQQSKQGFIKDLIRADMEKNERR